MCVFTRKEGRDGPGSGKPTDLEGTITTVHTIAVRRNTAG